MHALSNNSNLFYWGWLSNAKLCHEQNDKKWHQNNVSTDALLALSYYYLAPVRKVLLIAHHDRCCSLVKLLSVYFCYFKLLYHS